MPVQTTERLGCPHCKSDAWLVSYEQISAGYSVVLTRENGRIVPSYTGESTRYLDGGEYNGDLWCQNFACDTDISQDDLVVVTEP